MHPQRTQPSRHGTGERADRRGGASGESPPRGRVARMERVPRQLLNLDEEGEDEGGRKEEGWSPFDMLFACTCDRMSRADCGGYRWYLCPKHRGPACTKL